VNAFHINCQPDVSERMSETAGGFSVNPGFDPFKLSGRISQGAGLFDTGLRIVFALLTWRCFNKPLSPSRKRWTINWTMALFPVSGGIRNTLILLARPAGLEPATF
jgi:hypothetical protein